MPDWIKSLGDNKVLLGFAIVVVVILCAMLLVALYRFLFGPRIRAGARGRSRQPRLGVVDAFDLDRQRQLVLVRRDNVEHLILIGGPNDLLVEPAIIRLQPALSVATSREKDSAVAAPLAPMGPAF